MKKPQIQKSQTGWNERYLVEPWLIFGYFYAFPGLDTSGNFCARRSSARALQSDLQQLMHVSVQT